MYPPDLTLQKYTFGTREQTGGEQEADRRPHHPLLSLRANRRQARRRRSLSNVETGFPVVGGCPPPRSRALLPEGQGCLTRDFVCLKHHCYRSLGVTALNSCCFCLWVFNISTVVLVPSIWQRDSAVITHMSPRS